MAEQYWRLYLKNCFYCGKRSYKHDKCSICGILLHDKDYPCENCGTTHTKRGLNQDLCQECDGKL